jgi:hypothetical protein
MATTNNLFPVFDVPAQLADDIQTGQRYLPAPLFDIESGEFILSGARQALYGSGIDAWILWCTKTILTQRWGYLGYSNNAGIEAEQAFNEPNRAAQESAFTRTISEALLADPMGRTQQVRNFQYRWLADSLWISCEVVGYDGNSAAIQADIRR